MRQDENGWLQHETPLQWTWRILKRAVLMVAVFLVVMGATAIITVLLTNRLAASSPSGPEDHGSPDYYALRAKSTLETHNAPVRDSILCAWKISPGRFSAGTLAYYGRGRKHTVWDRSWGDGPRCLFTDDNHHNHWAMKRDWGESAIYYGDGSSHFD